MKSIRTAGSLLAAGALLAAPTMATAATPASGVVPTIKAQDKILRANPEFKELSHFKISGAAQAREQVSKLKTLGRQIDSAATAVAHASATSAQKAGQRDWVTGARDEAAGVKDLGVVLQDGLARKVSAEKAELVKAEKLVAAGDVIGTKADKLLHLPQSD